MYVYMFGLLCKATAWLGAVRRRWPATFVLCSNIHFLARALVVDMSAATLYDNGEMAFPFEPRKLFTSSQHLALPACPQRPRALSLFQCGRLW